jgi:hypothetical protein
MIFYSQKGAGNVTTYNRSDRRHWRRTLRRISWRVYRRRAVLAVAVLLPSRAPVAAQAMAVLR